LSGTIYVALIVTAILLGNFVFAAIFGVLCAMTTREFHQLTNKQSNVNGAVTVGMLCSFLLFEGVYLFNSNYTKLFNTAKILFFIYILLLFGVFIIEVFRKKTNPINNIAYGFLGQIYIAVPFALMAVIFTKVNAVLLLALFVIIWVNDSFAYLVGTRFGKHRLCERISPKKSWEGFCGGLLGAMITGCVFSFFFPQLNLLQWLVFVLITVVFGTFGDLLESLIKRTAGVKDSGNIMPGHGGFLDRLDSVIFAAPAVVVFLLLFS
jgi:phosphatidate cytidylyltransferase